MMMTTMNLTTIEPAIMRADPAYVARIVALAREVEAAPHGGKAALYEAAARELSVSVVTVKRDAGEASGRKRKVRRDAGRSKVSGKELDVISGYMMGGYRANKKKIVSVKKAVSVLKSNGVIRCEAVNTETGEIRPVSLGTVARAMKAKGVHPKQLTRAAPAVRQKSLHPNHVWQIDASISTLFYVPDEGLADMPPGEFYKNKLGNFERIKRQRLTRYCVTDHYSVWIFVCYVAGGESAENMAEALIRCMCAHAASRARMMHGVPFLLMTDPGSAPKSGAIGNLCRRLGIEIIVNAPGNARAKGQVEKAHDIVECDFESGFKFTHVPGLDWINEQARRWCVWFNATQEHSRHGMTRHAKWMEIAASQLREVNEEVARQMLTATPQARCVEDRLEVRFNGKTYSVAAVPGVMIGEKLAIAINPFNRETAWVVDVALDGSELLTEIPEVKFDSAGFSADANVIGAGYQALPETPAQKSLKRIKRQMYGAETDWDADCAERKKTPVFGGRIDPYWIFDDLPAVIPMPRRGTRLSTTATVAAAPVAPLTHFQAAQALAARGIAMDATKNRCVMEWCPDGVPEAEIAALAERLAALAALRVVGAGS
jgi:transposase InsO family protein